MPTLPDPFLTLPERFARLSEIAHGLSAEAKAEARAKRYSFTHLTRLECQMLLKMLQSVNAGEGDEVLVALTEHMASAERRRARGRSIARKRREGDQ
jgi:hypothetical protein